MSKFIVEWFSQFDPTKNKKYTQWILNQWLSEALWLEDAPKLNQTLETFEQYRKKLHKMDIEDRVPNQGPPDDDAVPPPERRADINNWKDYRTLARAMRPFVGIQAAGEKVTNFLNKPGIQDFMHHPVPDPVATFGAEGDFDIDEIKSEGHMDGEEFDTMDWYDWDIGGEQDATTAIKTIYKSDRLAVLQPNTRAASCELGKGTEWCTAYTTADNYFWNYAIDGPLYVIITDKMGKFHFHFESGQFANVHDDMLNNNERKELIQAYPELREIFSKQAEQHGQLWLIDPQTLTPEWVQNAINAIDSKQADIDTTTSFSNILGDIPYLDGVDEKSKLMAEDWHRKTHPIDAWRNIRKPTEKDYYTALTTKAADIRAYNPTTGILKQAHDRGIELSDQTLEAAMARDGEAIMFISPEKMRQHPEWVLAAIQQLPRMLNHAASTAILGEPVWGELADDQDEERHKAIIDILRKHPDGIKAVMNATKQDPSLIHQYRDWFGIEPWKDAYHRAIGGTKNFDVGSLDDTIRNGGMKTLDYNELMAYMIDNDLIRQNTFHAIESAMGGQVPVQLQKALLDKNPAYMTFFKNIDPQLKQAAMDSIIAKQQSNTTGNIS
jgi:hypothetical protein